MGRISSTWLYLAAAISLFCFIYFIESKSKTTDDVRSTRHLLYEFNPDEVSSIEIDNAKGSVTLQKDADHWRIVKPVNTAADLDAVRQVLEGLRFAMHSRVIPYSSVPGNKEETIKLWNLNPAAVHVIFKTPANTYHFFAGRSVALSEMIYARASDQAGDPVYIVNEMFKKSVDKDLSSLRSRGVFDFDPLDAIKFSVREFASGVESSQSTEVFKNKEGLWSMQKPLVARTNQLKVDEWIRKLLELKVADFVSDEEANLSSFGLDAPYLQIMMESGRGQRINETTLLVGSALPNKVEQRYAKLLKSSTVFTIDEKLISSMVEQLGGLRSRYLMAFEPKRISRISFDTQGKAIVVRQVGGYWKLEGTDGSFADEKVIMNILNQLDVAEINFVKDSAVDLHPYGLDNPSTRIIMQQYATETPPTIEVDLGKIENGQIYAKTSLEPFVYGAPLRLLDLIPRDELMLRRLALISVRGPEFSSLKVEAAGKPPIVVVIDKQGNFKADKPSMTLDQVKAERMVSLMEKFRASQWLGPVQASYGLDAPSLRFTLSTSAGKSYRLDVGSRLPNGEYAGQIDNQQGVFEISEANYKTLSQDIVMPVNQAAPSAGAPAR